MMFSFHLVHHCSLGVSPKIPLAISRRSTARSIHSTMRELLLISWIRESVRCWSIRSKPIDFIKLRIWRFSLSCSLTISLLALIAASIHVLYLSIARSSTRCNSIMVFAKFDGCKSFIDSI